MGIKLYMKKMRAWLQKQWDESGSLQLEEQKLQNFGRDVEARETKIQVAMSLVRKKTGKWNN